MISFGDFTMEKSFREFLAESAKEYPLVLRFAVAIGDREVDKIERFLSKYDLRSITSVKITPITKNSMFFPEVENTEVSKIDIVTGYPMAADILRQQLADLLEMNITHILVHKEGWEPEEEVEVDADRPALLDSDYDDASDDGEHYGQKFISNFLKELSKSEKATVENELSVKPKEDPKPKQMDTEEKSSKSVISGERR